MKAWILLLVTVFSTSLSFASEKPMSLEQGVERLNYMRFHHNWEYCNYSFPFRFGSCRRFLEDAQAGADAIVLYGMNELLTVTDSEQQAALVQVIAAATDIRMILVRGGNAHDLVNRIYPKAKATWKIGYDYIRDYHHE